MLNWLARLILRLSSNPRNAARFRAAYDGSTVHYDMSPEEIERFVAQCPTTATLPDASWD